MNTSLTCLLIYPEVTRSKYSFVGIIEDECHELEYIQTMLTAENHRVIIYDGQIEPVSVRSVIEEHAPDIVYLCGKTRQERFMLEYCELAKRIDPHIVTMIGGNHAHVAAQRLFQDSVDYIFTSFNIYHILKVIRHAFFDPTVNLREVEGICYRENGEWQQNKAEPFDIKCLPRPDRSYFDAHPDNYPYLELSHAAWVRTAFSCPYRCRFCIRNRMNCGKYSARDIADVVDEIAHIQSDHIYIVDDDFLVNEKRVREFIDTVKARGIHKRYICYGRADFIAKHEDLLRDFADIGLYYVLVGLEAFDDRYLKDYNKKTDMQKNIQTIDICRRVGVHLMAMFILDLDYTRRDFVNLYRFIKKHDLVHVAVSIFTPEMGLETYEACKDELITDDPADFDYMHLVVKPTNIGVRRYYIYYYLLIIKLFLKAQRDGIYDFLDYKRYILSFIKSIFLSAKNKRWD